MNSAHNLQAGQPQTFFCLLRIVLTVSNGNSFDRCTAMNLSELYSTSSHSQFVLGRWFNVQPQPLHGLKWDINLSLLPNRPQWAPILLSIYDGTSGDYVGEAFFLPSSEHMQVVTPGDFPLVTSTDNGLNRNRTKTRAVNCKTHVRRGSSLSSELIIPHLY